MTQLPPTAPHSSETEEPEAASPAQSVIPWWAWITAIAVVLLAAYSLYQTRTVETDLARLREQSRQAQLNRQNLASLRREYETMATLLAAPATHKVRLKPSRPELPAVMAFWNDQMGVLLSAQNFPAPARDRVWQLWIVPKKGEPTRAGVLQPDQTGNLLQFIRFESSIHITDATALAISEEPAGTGPRPSSALAWRGSLK